jgi:RNA polymerase sigma-70 factor (ECF subfamily)
LTPETALADELIRHAGFLRGIVGRLLRDDAAVDDVLQDTYVAALARPPRHRGNVRAWLATVARNFARRRLRTGDRVRRRERAAARPEALPSAESVVSALEWQRRVVEAVLALPEPLRATVVLRFHEGRSVREIAAARGMRPVDVEVVLRTALSRLRSRLDAAPGGARGAWIVPLGLSLGLREASAAPAAGAATLAAGGIAMGVKGAFAGAAAVAALSFYAGWTLRPEPPSEAPPRAPSEAGGPPVLSGRTPRPSTVPVVAAAEPGHAAATASAAVAAPEEWLRRINDAPNDDAVQAVASELARLEPAAGTAVLEGIYARIEPPFRRTVTLIQFYFHRDLARILHLGATDPDPKVQGETLRVLSRIGHRDFVADFGAYLRWHATEGGLPRDELLRRQALAWVGRVERLEGADLEREVLRNSEWTRGYPPVVTPDVVAAVKEAGFLETIARWLGSDATGEKVKWAALEWLPTLQPDETWAKRSVLPFLADPAAHRLVTPACLALSRRGWSWAVDPLCRAYVETPRKEDWADITHALTWIGDARAIPSMIGVVVAADATQPDAAGRVHDMGLWEMTRVPRRHDAAWWLDWWEKNRERYPPEVRSTEIPRLSPKALSAPRGPSDADGESSDG